MILSRAAGILALAAVSQAQNFFRIAGAPVYNASVPLRQDINQLQATGGPQWDLYLLALAQFYKKPYQDTLSFFQVAGIHGKPFVEWNDTGGQQADGWPGYCPHGELIFLTWHRPYVMLFEQILVSTALAIAQTYPPQYRQQYIAAAQTLRAPYWDWANDSNVPSATVPSTITVTVPNSSGNGVVQIQIPNPLSTYNFPNNGFTDCGSSIDRCPSPNSYPASANENMASRSYREWTYDVLSYTDNFQDFASTGYQGVSLEGIHNSVHWDAACGEQFLAPDCSAFDPIFFLHHAQVDRIWAMFEALYPSQTVFTGSYKGQSRWNTRSGTTISPSSRLQPFYDGSGSSWNSKSSAAGLGYTSSVGYTYHGMESGKSAAQMKRDVATIINTMYKPQDDNFGKRGWLPYMTRYFVHIAALAEDFSKLPCNIEICLGNMTLGSVVIMKLPSTGPVNNAFSIDRKVRQIQQSDESAAADFAEYFKDNVIFRIKTPGGDSIDPETVKSLVIRLETSNVTNPQAVDQLPKTLSKVTHVNMTAEQMISKLKQKLGKWGTFMDGY